MRYFCTYFNSSYLPRALCLIDSMEKHCSSFTIYTLCFDDESYQYIKKLGNINVIPIQLEDLEASEPDLISVKKERSKIEYFYTCGPALINYVMEYNKGIDILTYLDADIYFFSDPSPLFDAFEGHSIGVIGHHLPEFRNRGTRHRSRGIYNVGWLNFRRDQDGMACIKWWRDRCVEWCFERFEDGKYADQLYLNQWPEMFKGFYEYTHHGANVGLWNRTDYRFSLKYGRLYADDDPVIFYHFHALKKISRNVYNTNMGMGRKAPHPLITEMYLEYIRRLEYHAQNHNPTASIRNYRAKYFWIKTPIRIFLGLLFHQYINIKGRL